MLSRKQTAAGTVLGLVFIWLLASGWSRSDKAPRVTVPAPIGKTAFRQRLVAVGDLHGGQSLPLLISIGLILRNADIDNAKKVLRMAKVIDDKADWAGGSDILVQTGDIVDRGTYALDIYRLMQKLRGQADAAGGRVVSILGNHEIMNAIGDWRWASAVGEVADCVRYVTSADIKRFGSSTKRQQDLSSEGWLGQEWLAK